MMQRNYPRAAAARDSSGGQQRRMITRGARARSLAVMAVAAALALAACGGSSGAAPSSKPFGVGATGVVRFWARQATDGVAKAMVAQFNASHPHLKVQLHLTQPNQATTELGTAIRAGSVPDLVGLNDINVPTFTHENALMNLTKYINALPYKNSLSPGHMKLATDNGQLFGIPYLADLSVLWYNKKLFREAGLDPNTPPASYAEILSDAEKINALGHGISGFSFAGNCQGCLGFTMLPSIWASGQHLISGPLGTQQANVAGNAPLQQLLGFYRQLWAKHLVPVADQTQNGLTWGKDFESGKVGILPGDYGFAAAFTTPAQKAEFADAPLPAVSGGGFATFDGGDDFVIPKGASNPSGGWEFAQWVLQQRQQTQYPSLGMTPVRSDVLTPGFQAKNAYDAVALKALANGSVEYTLAYNAVFNAPGSPWFKMFEAAVYNGNVSAGIQEGQSGIQSTLDAVK
jgi:multiple sugar transport system substrate-binding protein